MKKYSSKLKSILQKLKNKKAIFKLAVCNKDNFLYPIKNEVIGCTVFLNNYNPKFSERVYCILNDIYELKLCKCDCGNYIFIK